MSNKKSNWGWGIFIIPILILLVNNRGDFACNTSNKTASQRIAFTETKTDAKTHYNRGIEKARLGKNVEAIADFDTAIRLKPKYAEAYCERGKIKARISQVFASITDFDTAIRLKPKYAEAYYCRGMAKRALGERGAALTDFNTAILLKDGYVDAYISRGLLKYNYATAPDKQWLKWVPQMPTSIWEEETRKRKHEWCEAAISDFDAVIEINPKHVEAYCYRGMTRLEMGQYLAALPDFDTAIRLKPDYAAAYFYRGSVRHYLFGINYPLDGVNQEALQDWQTALKLATQAGDTELKNSVESTLNYYTTTD